MESEVTKQLENWFIMLNTPENDELDAGIVRDEIKEVLLKRYATKIGTEFVLSKDKDVSKEVIEK